MQPPRRPLHRKEIKAHKPKNKVPYINMVWSETLALSDGFKPNPFRFVIKDQSNKSLAIAVLQSTSKTLFKQRFLSHRGVILMALNPHSVCRKFMNVIEIDSEGILRPADIPDLSDLALQPKFLKCYYEWLLRNSTQSTICETLAEIQAQTSTSIPRNQEMFYLDDNACHELRVKSFSDVMKTIVFNENMIEAVQFDFETKENTRDWRDGRTTSVVVGLRSTTTPPTVGIKRKRYNDSVRKMIIWNCRGLAKIGFRKVYGYLLKSHWPDILVLTEARVSEFLAHSIIPKESYESMEVFEPNGLVGGVVILTMSEDLKVVMTRMYNSCAVEILLL